MGKKRKLFLTVEIKLMNVGRMKTEEVKKNHHFVIKERIINRC